MRLLRQGISRLHFCADAPAFCFDRDLANAGNSWNKIYVNAVGHSHVTHAKSGTGLDQFVAKILHRRHGPCVHRHHHPGHHDGGEIWAQSPGRVLLPGVRSGFSVAADFDSNRSIENFVPPLLPAVFPRHRRKDARAFPRFLFVK